MRNFKKILTLNKKKNLMLLESILEKRFLMIWIYEMILLLLNDIL